MKDMSTFKVGAYGLLPASERLCFPCLLLLLYTDGTTATMLQFHTRRADQFPTD